MKYVFFIFCTLEVLELKSPFSYKSYLACTMHQLSLEPPRNNKASILLHKASRYNLIWCVLRLFPSERQHFDLKCLPCPPMMWFCISLMRIQIWILDRPREKKKHFKTFFPTWSYYRCIKPKFNFLFLKIFWFRIHITAVLYMSQWMTQEIECRARYHFSFSSLPSALEVLKARRLKTMESNSSNRLLGKLSIKKCSFEWKWRRFLKPCNFPPILLKFPLNWTGHIFHSFFFHESPFVSSIRQNFRSGFLIFRTSEG